MLSVKPHALTAQAVADYLADHPDFFHQHPHLLDRLHLPHVAQGSVSLWQVQMNRQRQKMTELEEEITQLMAIAAGNDRIFHQFMDVQLALLASKSGQEAYQHIRTLAKSLNLVVYFQWFERVSTGYCLTKAQWQRFAAQHIHGKSAYLGRLRQVDRQLLFGEANNAPEMGSYLVMPLMAAQNVQGMLAFSSQDGGHFQPSMDTLLVQHLVHIFSHLLQVLPWQEEQDGASSTA